MTADTCIERGLSEAKETLALFRLLSRALASGDDLGMDLDQASRAWAKLTDLADEAYETLSAVERRLPFDVKGLRVMDGGA